MECDGPMSFASFMAAALYEPSLGYYARETRQIGRGGDFFTSVSVGPLFGEFLARRFLREWRESGSPERWRIIECGAHDGTLAADILGALSHFDPQAFGAVEYAIPEPLALLQKAQQETLAAFKGKMRFIRDARELFAEPLPGVAFGNELLDALPFHIVERKAASWRECRVTLGPNNDFIWETNSVPVDPELLDALALLDDDFPDGYRTEVRTNFQDIIAPLTRCLTSGLFVWPDYGFARPEYYHPDRSAGTLRTFFKHRAAENPLSTPGDIDITAHVDFTSVAETAIRLGCQALLFKSQGAWLTEIGRDWLLSQEGNPDAAALRQFQTLTHPAHLGGSFHVLEFSWNQTHRHLSSADLHRLALDRK